MSVTFLTKILYATVIALIVGGITYISCRSLLSLTATNALLVSLNLSSWAFFLYFCFFSSKHRLAANIAVTSQTTEIVKALITTHSNLNLKNTEQKWRNLLQLLFQPNKIEQRDIDSQHSSGIQHTKTDISLMKPTLNDSGASMNISSLMSNKIYVLHKPLGDDHKFSNNDIELAWHVAQIFMTTDSVCTKLKKLAKAQQKQLAKDIHDDLSAKLLHILTISDNEHKQVALDALSDLRNILNQLDSNIVGLLEVFADIRLEMRSRVSFYEAEFIWDNQIPDSSEIEVTSHMANNLRRIFREATTNALKYMDNDYIKVQIFINKQGFLSINIINAGSYIPHNYHNGSGKGLSNIVSRASQIQGHVNWQKKDNSFEIKLLINLQLIKLDKQTSTNTLDDKTI